MSYNDLSQSTLTDDERWAEKNRLVKILEDAGVNDSQRQFIEKMKRAAFVSVKQLFYLRDLASK